MRELTFDTGVQKYTVNGVEVEDTEESNTADDAE